MADRVLVVDDDPALLSLEAALLEAAGLEVATAEGGAEALQKLKESHFDLVVSDFEMPGIDGIELLARVRDTDPDVIVVICTSHGRVEVAVRSLTAGAFDFVQKPFDLEHFVAVVQRGLKHRRLRDATNVYAAAQAVFETTDPGLLPQRIVEAAASVMQAEYAATLVRTPFDTYEPSGLFHGRWFADDATFGALREASVGMVASREPRILTLPKAFAAGHPLTAADRVLGVLWTARRTTGRPYVQRDIEHLALVAAQGALALDNQRLVLDLQKRVEALEKARRRLYVSARIEGIGRIALDLASRTQNPLSYVRTNLRDVQRHFAPDAMHGAEEPIDAATAGKRLDAALEGLGRIELVLADLAGVAQTRDRAQFEVGAVCELAVRVARVSHAVVVEVASDAVVQGNAGQLAQALVALIHNATQACEHKPDAVIRLRLRLEGGKAVIEVQDEGDGIPAERLPLVMEPFYSTRNRSGMGLPSVREIVEHHGGTVKMRSTSGQGTLVTITLPDARPPEEDIEL